MQRLGSRALVAFGVLVSALIAQTGCAASVDVDDDTRDDALGGVALPPCASARMRAIFDASKKHAAKGSVPEKLFVTQRNHADATPLVTGREIFPAIADLIASAQSEVVFQTFAWDTGSDPARELLAGLKRLEARRRAERDAAAPVFVRLNVEAAAISSGQMRRIPEIAKTIEELSLDPAHVRVEIAAFLHGSLGSLHSKTVVVDGTAAIVTGANPEAVHDYATPWHDTGYRFEGEIAEALLADFDHRWKEAKLWTCGGNTDGSPGSCLQPTPPLLRTVDRSRVSGVLANVCVPMLMATRDGDGNPLGNRIDNTQDQAFLAAMRAASDTIRIQTPNLNDDAAKRGIIEAVRRGVRVDLVVSKGFNDDSEGLPGQGGTNEENVRELYETLRDAGMTDACERFRVRWFSQDGVDPVIGNGPYASHTKYMSLDGAIAIVGSGNMDTQTWNHSHETNVVVDDVATTRSWDSKMFAPSFERGVRAEACAER